MPTISDRKQPMNSACQITELTRAAAEELVSYEERRTGSRMAAYVDVASAVGATASWVRKFIGRSPDAKPGLVVGINILRLVYNDLCTRVEQERDNERARLVALREQIDAAFPGPLGMVVRTPRAATDGTLAEKHREEF